MALRTLNNLQLWPPWPRTYYPITMDVADEKVAFVVRVPQSGTIEKLGLCTGTVKTPQSLSVGLQTVDASGDPSGSAYGGSVAGTIATPAQNTYYTVTLATSASATAGDIVAVVVSWAGAVGEVGLRAHSRESAFPYTDHYIASWTKQIYIPVTHFEYSGGIVPDMNTAPFSDLGTYSFTASTTPDEYALKFQVPFPARVRGFVLMGGADAGGEFDVVLYDSANNVLGSRSYPASAVVTSAEVRGTFPSAVTISKDSIYRLAMKPTTANNVYVNYFQVASTAIWNAIPGGTGLIQSSRTDGGSWTDVTTRRPGITVVFDQFDDAPRTAKGQDIWV